MSNLPPGVTGNEYEIAGPDAEYDEHRECNAQGVSTLTTSRFGMDRINLSMTALAEIPKSVEDPEQVQRLVNGVMFNLRYALAEIEAVDIETTCPFVGDVMITYFNGTEQWTCPVCRTEHESEVE